MKKIVLLILLFSNIAPMIKAGGPKQVAKIDRSLWPYEISSTEEFDFASKMEMLVFIDVFQLRDQIMIEDSIKKFLGVEKISMSSINLWKEQTKKVLMSNFNALTNTSVHNFIEIPKPINWQGLANAASSLEKSVPGNLKAWFTEAKAFYDSYIYEQMRLAALFPRVTSEILTLQNSEVNGFTFGDKQFLLTFDDGPTLSGGNTDKLISTLSKNHMNGVFFVLGDNFNARLKASSEQKMNELYNSVVVGSHGKVHNVHPKYSEWQYSITFTKHLIDSVITENNRAGYFRPPYGQRNDNMIEFLGQNDIRVMLWNIDSQDWNAKITSGEVADRVITLILLWRKGVLLFHDSHSKANEALPIIWNSLKNSDVNWMDAKQMK